jgi:hypothetical protein
MKCVSDSSLLPAHEKAANGLESGSCNGLGENIRLLLQCVNLDNLDTTVLDFLLEKNVDGPSNVLGAWCYLRWVGNGNAPIVVLEYLGLHAYGIVLIKTQVFSYFVHEFSQWKQAAHRFREGNSLTLRSEYSSPILRQQLQK